MFRPCAATKGDGIVSRWRTLVTLLVLLEVFKILFEKISMFKVSVNTIDKL